LGDVGSEASSQVMGGVGPAVAGVMTRGNEAFRAVEVVVDRGGFAGVPGGLSTNCLGVLCRARHLALQTGEAFVCECRASSQGKTVGARVESREPYTEAGSWQIAAGSSDVSRSQLVEWSTRGAKSKAQSGKRRRQRAPGSSVPSAECGVRNADTKF